MADSYPPGTNLCQIAIASPPHGHVSNLDDPASMRLLIIATTVVCTTLSAVFTFGRLYSNIKKLSWSDGLVFTALLIDIVIGVLMCVFARYSRHMWNIPLCWPVAQYLEFVYTTEILTAFGLFFAKYATLHLFHQVFTQTSAAMRWAIRAGHAVNFLVYAVSIAVWSYAAAPRPGEAWDDLLREMERRPDRFGLEFRYAEGQAPFVLLLDLYMFLLPLPCIAGLKLSFGKRLRVMAIFGVAALGMVAVSANLVYRIKAVSSSDQTYLAAAIFMCTQVEMNVATIVASMPAFTAFCRVYVWDSQMLRALRTRLGHDPDQIVARKQRQDPNRPRSGLDDHRAQKKVLDHDLDDSWLMRTQSTA